MRFVVRRADRDKARAKVLGLGKDVAKDPDKDKDEARVKADRRSTVFNPASRLTTTSRRVRKAVFNHNNQARSCLVQMIRARNFSFICRRKLNIYSIPTTLMVSISPSDHATVMRLPPQVIYPIIRSEFLSLPMIR